MLCGPSLLALPGGCDPQSTTPQGIRRHHRAWSTAGALWVRGPLPGLVPSAAWVEGGGGRDLDVPGS